MQVHDSRLSDILAEIVNSSEINVSLLCSPDGFPIAFSVESASAEDVALLTAAMTAAVHSISNQAVSELENAGKFQTTIIESDKGNFLIKEITDKILFCCYVKKTSETLGARVRSYMIGIALSTMENSITKIKKYLDSMDKNSST
ncbi:MAG: roadblock/LC7 domain-containing protein [Promethearchaeota archaeon]